MKGIAVERDNAAASDRRTAMRAAAPWLPLLLFLVTTTAADEDRHAVHGVARTLWLGAKPVAVVEEKIDGDVIHRHLDLPSAWGSDRSVLEVKRGKDGDLQYAHYQRRGPRGGRDVAIEIVSGRGTLRTPHGTFVLPGERPVVLLDLLGHERPASPVEVTFLDLPSGEYLPGKLLVSPSGRETLALDLAGHEIAAAIYQASARRGPGAFSEVKQGSHGLYRGDAPLHPPLPAAPGAYAALRLVAEGAVPWSSMALDGPGQSLIEAPNVVACRPQYADIRPPEPQHLAAAPFLEVDHPDVVEFARRVGRRENGLAAALLLAEAVHGNLDFDDGGGPPSAVLALERQAGDCDDAAALVVAALRATGHPARPVVGYRHLGGVLVPHAWAEVYSDGRWHPVDATLPGVGPFESHLRLFEGLGSPFTMGRVLGALRVVPVDRADL
ncbi:MAG: transglutaminase domain-containing protein [Myxococcota bacterium]